MMPPLNREICLAIAAELSSSTCLEIKDIAAAVDSTPARVSEHLALLRRHGLLRTYGVRHRLSASGRTALLNTRKGMRGQTIP